MTVAAGVALAVALAREGSILVGRWAILGRIGAWAAAWVVAVVCAFLLPRRVALPAVLVAGVLLRVAALAGSPPLSDDLYRYSWDGRVQEAGINPYRHAPESPALAQLREPWLWPDAAGCEAIDRAEGCTRMNRPSARTIYPPVAQAWFNAVYRVAGIDAKHKAWQVAGFVTDVAVLALLPLVLAAWRRDTRWTALYALSPFPALEVVNNGHVDGLAVLFIVLALLLAARRRPGWAGVLIGAAALVKLYPAVLVVGLVGVAARGKERSRWSPLIGAGLAAGAVGVAGYLPHVVSVGTRVLGYLPGYLREEQYDEGGRYLLAGMLGVSGSVASALAIAAVGAVVVWVVVRRPDPPVACATLLGALLLATTPVQPWYAVTLLAAACGAGRPAWAAVGAAAYPYFFAVVLDYDHAVAVGRLSYGLALAIVAAAAWTRRRASPPVASHS